MDLANLLMVLIAIGAITFALMLELYKALGKKRRSIEGFEVVALNLIGWSLISFSGMLLGIVIMRSAVLA